MINRTRQKPGKSSEKIENEIYRLIEAEKVKAK